MASGQPTTHLGESQQLEQQAPRTFRDSHRTPFPEILYEAINYAERNVELSSIFCWDQEGSSASSSHQTGSNHNNGIGTKFIVYDIDEFMKEIASKFFPSNSSFRSIERMLTQWQFRRHHDYETVVFGMSDRKYRSKHRIYSHPNFLRDHRDLLKYIERKPHGNLGSKTVASFATTSRHQTQAKQQPQQPIANIMNIPPIANTSVTTERFLPSSVGQFRRLPKETAGHNVTETIELATKRSDDKMEASSTVLGTNVQTSASSTVISTTSPLPVTKIRNLLPGATTKNFSPDHRNQRFSSLSTSFRHERFYPDLKPKCKPQLQQMILSRTNFRFGEVSDSGFYRLDYLRSLGKGIGSGVDKILPNVDNRLGAMIQEDEQNEPQQNERTQNCSPRYFQHRNNALMPSHQFEDASADESLPIRSAETDIGQRTTISQFEDADIDCNDLPVSDGDIENGVCLDQGGTADGEDEGEDDNVSIGSELII